MTGMAPRTLGAITLVILILILSACDQDSKRIRVRFKFEPGMNLSYQQVTRGLVRITDTELGTVLVDEYAETTMDIQYQVRRILEDSTAEIIESKVLRSRMEDRLDPTSTDTIAKEPEEGPQIVTYLKPSGKLVDMEFTSDTATGHIEYLKEYYKQGFPEFPAGEMSQGHSWTQTNNVVLPDGPMQASTTYTIRSFARERGYDCVVIEYDGLSIIPLTACSIGVKYRIIGGVDNMTSNGHMYFAYKEGIVVLSRERWILNSDRVVVMSEADTVRGLQPGDTTRINVGIEYDVDYYLTKVDMP